MRLAACPPSETVLRVRAEGLESSPVSDSSTNGENLHIDPNYCNLRYWSIRKGHKLWETPISYNLQYHIKQLDNPRFLFGFPFSFPFSFK